MRLLLDTHTLLWWLAEGPHLGSAAATAIETETAVFVSAATAWEIAIKRAAGKLRAPADLAAAVREEGFQELDVTLSHGLAAGALPLHHKDPFDRMLVAQAQIERLTLVTSDRRIRAYDVAVLPAS